MEEKDFNPIVKMFFQDHGFTANEIPREKDKQTPDFDVIGKNDRYTVELKIKSDDPNEIARDNEFLSKGQMVTKSIPIGLLTTENTVQLCINSLSPRVNDFRGSDLYKSLIKGLCDPIKYELADGVMIADCEIDRKEENQILNYLMKKYCLKHLQTIPMQQNSAAISMPINQS